MPAAQPPMFSCAQTVTVRLPVRPRALIRQYGVPAAPCLLDESGLSVAPGTSDEHDQLADYLTTAAQDELLLEAITLSSPSLRQRLDRLRTDPPGDLRPCPAALRKAARAVAGYQLRMASRPTPFGTFAAVALARIGAPGESARVTLGEAHRRAVRPDAQWLLTLVSQWEQRREVADRLRVVVNSLAAVRGDRLVLSHVASLKTERLVRGTAQDTFFEVALPLNELTAAVLESAQHPVILRELREALGTHFAQDAVDAALALLVRREFLLTEARPAAHEQDPIGAVLDRLHGIPGMPELPALREVRASLARYSTVPPGGALRALERAREAMRELLPGEPTPLQVDLAADADIALPAEVAREAERAAEALWRLSPPGPPPHLQAYYEEFTEAYGTDVAVPLRELLDPDTGLGPPQDYRHPPTLRRRTATPPPPETPERARLLADLVFQAVRTGSQEVTLDAESFRRLDRTATDDDATGPPPSTDFPARLLARSTGELDAGDFRLWLTTGPGSDLAGAASTRFAHALGPAGTELLADVARRSALRYSPALTAQLECRPTPFRSENIARLPRWADHRLPVGLYADPADPLTIDPSDLAVVADDRRLRLISLSRGCEIVPLSFHMLEFERHAPNLARFLTELPLTGVRPWRSWDWGALSAAPFLPRVRRGRTVLAAARWRLDAHLCSSTPPEPRSWAREFTAWAERSELPRRVLLGSGDQRVEIDASRAAHVELIRREAARGLPLTLEEAPFLPGPRGPDPGDGWLTGPSGAHSNEVVFPLLTRPPVATSRPPRAQPVQPPHLVGGPWLYAKLYLAYERHDEVIATHLPGLLTDLGDHADRWFFLRYGDPDPHLRFRFHGSPERLAREALPRLHAWAGRLRAAGLLRRMVVDEYRPETARYGGPQALELAERVFQADSELVSAQLAALRAGTLHGDPIVLCAVNQLDALRAVAGPEPWAPWLLARYPRVPHTASSRNRQRLLDQLLDEATDLPAPSAPAPAPTLARLTGPGPLASASTARAEVLAEYGRALRGLGRGLTAEEGRATPLPSILHLHYNRAVCIPPAAEDTVLALVRNAVQTRLDRRARQP
ncbi:lantibiotic dehydratase [Streptomyces sp. NPDC048111]|uniref:lantibiotic dehydratase n=1 Tax=Streptomyces sp. NPDC048111 TaxID=3365500 RepID=UPI00371D45A1